MIEFIRLHAISLLLGMVTGIIIHYTLYRLGMPLEPFIYVAF
jgi:hypothetical protein